MAESDNNTIIIINVIILLLDGYQNKFKKFPNYFPTTQKYSNQTENSFWIYKLLNSYQSNTNSPIFHQIPKNSQKPQKTTKFGHLPRAK